MEHCAAHLEAMRVRVLSLGGTNQEIAGAFHGNFLFLGPEGVFSAESYTGPRYPFLVRSGDAAGACGVRSIGTTAVAVDLGVGGSATKVLWRRLRTKQ